MRKFLYRLILLVSCLVLTGLPVHAACHTGGCMLELTPEEQVVAVQAKQRADNVVQIVLAVGFGAFLGLFSYQYLRERRPLRE